MPLKFIIFINVINLIALIFVSLNCEAAGALVRCNDLDCFMFIVINFNNMIVMEIIQRIVFEPHISIQHNIVLVHLEIKVIIQMIRLHLKYSNFVCNILVIEYNIIH